MGRAARPVGHPRVRRPHPHRLTVLQVLVLGAETHEKDQLAVWGEARRALANRYRQPLFVLTAVLWALAASLHYATSVARDLREGHGRPVRVELIATPPSGGVDTTPQLLLGTTQKYVFLYDAQKQMTSVIPVSNVSRIRIDRRKVVPVSAPIGTSPPPARQ